MKNTILYMLSNIVAVSLVFCAGTWAYVFYVILRDGEVTFYEPNVPWLIAEFGFAVFLTLLGVFVAAFVIKRSMHHG